MRNQGTNARKVISEVYALFELQFTVFGRKSKHKTNVTAWQGIHFHKKSMKYSGHKKLLCEFSKFSKFNAFNLPDTKRTLCIYSCLQSPSRENWFWYVRRVYATAINFPCFSTLCVYYVFILLVHFLLNIFKKLKSDICYHQNI